MSRTPMEIMIDKATGYDPLRRLAPVPAKQVDENLLGAAMVEVCQAARAWTKNKAKGGKRLRAAVRALNAAGY